MFYNNSLFPLLLSTIAGLSTLVGAIIIFFTQSKNEKFLTFALGFSAGVMIAVSFMDLFPTAGFCIVFVWNQNRTENALLSLLCLLPKLLILYVLNSLLVPFLFISQVLLQSSIFSFCYNWFLTSYKL